MQVITDAINKRDELNELLANHDCKLDKGVCQCTDITEEISRLDEELEDVCPECHDDGYIEVYGDGEHFEWDVVDTKPCPECNGN